MDDGCRLDLTRSKTIFANSGAAGDGGCLLVIDPWRPVSFEEIFGSASETKKGRKGTLFKCLVVLALKH